MRKREKAEMLIDYPYGFGEHGCPPRVPAKAQIIAKVELIDYTEESQADSILSLDTEERKAKFSFEELEKIAELEISNGNHSFQEKEFSLALKCYERGRRLLEGINLANEDQETRCNKMLQKIFLNLALAAIKLERPKKACIACREALNIEESAKAFYRFGVAKRQLGDYQAAKDLLLKAQRREPQSLSISKELMVLEDYLMHERKMEEAMCRNMFKNVAKDKVKVNAAVVDIYYKELKEFREDPDREIFKLTDPDLVCKDLKVRLGAGKFSFVISVVLGNS